ncbi:TolC family protein [Armatimonas sp.]|uniref:TolC family protein n=1 Tax=Armatimonas sp. TaxID=1872638 RepID=UPI0037503461
MFITLIFAQEVPAPSLTLETAVREALSHHRRLAAARKETDAARLAVRSAHARTNPEIYFAPALDQFNGTTEELLITQPLEINGTRTARTRGALAKLQVSHARLQTEQREVVGAVKTSYIQLWRERETQVLAKSLSETAQVVDRLAKKQVELGSRPGIDLAQTGLEVTRARQQETLALSRVRQAEAGLNGAMGRSPEAPLPAVELPTEKTEQITVEIAISGALTRRSEVSEETARREALRQETALARAEGKPDVAPQFRSQYVTFQTPKRSDYGFSVAVQLPLLDWGARRNKIQQTEAATLAQEDRIEQARQEIRREVVQALARLEGATAILASFTEALPQAQKLLKASQLGFEEGKTSVLAVLEAQRMYRTILTEYAQARAERALAQVELSRTMGGTP